MGAHADRDRRGAAKAQAAIDWTIAYVKERKVFGQAVAQFQNTRFKLAEMQTEVQIGAGVRRQVHRRCCSKTSSTPPPRRWPSTGSATWRTRSSTSACSCFGGYGYMWEYPIARAFADARVQRIYGGTNEIMKEVIARAMGLSGAMRRDEPAMTWRCRVTPSRSAPAAARRAARAAARARRRRARRRQPPPGAAARPPRSCSAPRALPPPARATSPPRWACTRARRSITSRARTRCSPP